MENGSQFAYTQNLHTQTIRASGETSKQVANVCIWAPLHFHFNAILVHLFFLVF